MIRIEFLELTALITAKPQRERASLYGSPLSIPTPSLISPLSKIFPLSKNFSPINKIEYEVHLSFFNRIERSPFFQRKPDFSIRIRGEGTSVNKTHTQFSAIFYNLGVCFHNIGLSSQPRIPLFVPNLGQFRVFMLFSRFSMHLQFFSRFSAFYELVFSMKFTVV